MSLIHHKSVGDVCMQGIPVKEGPSVVSLQKLIMDLR